MSGKKTYMVRLYRFHDRDLISFMETHNFNIAKALYVALNAFTHEDYVKIIIPPKADKRDKKLPNVRRGGGERASYTVSIRLDEEKDAEALDLLNRIESGYLNSFLKSILRLYLAAPVTTDFLIDPERDSEFFKKKCEIFSKDKRLANAGSLPRKNEMIIEDYDYSAIKDNSNNQGFDVSLPSPEPIAQTSFRTEEPKPVPQPQTAFENDKIKELEAQLAALRSQQEASASSSAPEATLSDEDIFLSESFANIL